MKLGRCCVGLHYGTVRELSLVLLAIKKVAQETGSNFPRQNVTRLAARWGVGRRDGWHSRPSVQSDTTPVKMANSLFYPL